MHYPNQPKHNVHTNNIELIFKKAIRKYSVGPCDCDTISNAMKGGSWKMLFLQQTLYKTEFSLLQVRLI